jgi:hypothetical protein
VLCAAQFPFSPDTPSKLDPFHHEETYGGLSLNPSLKVRLAQGVTDMVREHLMAYGRAYLNSDYKFKESGRWSLVWWPLIFSFEYDDLTHGPIKMDFSRMAFNYTHMMVDGQPVLFMELPLIEDMKFSMNYKGKFGLIPFGGQVSIEVA